ncbi:hypothetical protein DAPPUDRAFT_264042 [Daphnia pulex]|uniref:Zinc finger PHD-type domain-containing protein n=1 Tax=Daphnia pulex TaxID=6669 RepID=E9HQT1_DAPPU|nr:hypothetical protein DAPPUDRAFT_264042 [Daphnia pulex]|eukprot:EFX65890.1 hypothetical protein DAPPUDRAFT_264042 [Daphnia pulex]
MDVPMDLCVVCLLELDKYSKRPQLIPCSGRQCKVKIHRVCSSTPISATDYVLMKKPNEVFDYFCPKCSSHPSTSGSTTTRQVVAVENLAIAVTRKRGRPPKTREVVAVENSDVPVEVRKRGRPRKRPALPPSPTTTRHVNAPKRLCLRPVLSSSGVGLVDQDVTSTVTPIDVPFGSTIPQVIITPNEEPLCTVPENSEGSSRQTLPVEIEESSIRRTQSGITESAAKVVLSCGVATIVHKKIHEGNTFALIGQHSDSCHPIPGLDLQLTLLRDAKQAALNSKELPAKAIVEPLLYKLFKSNKKFLLPKIENWCRVVNRFREDERPPNPPKIDFELVKKVLPKEFQVHDINSKKPGRALVKGCGFHWTQCLSDN